MSNKIWRYSAGKRGESPAISGAAGPVAAIIDFTRIVGDEGRVLRAVRAGLIVAGGSAGSILGGPSNRSRTLVGGLSLVKKDRALELGWVEIKPRPRDSCQEESPSAEHQLRSNGPGDQRPAACIENVENQCSPKNRCFPGKGMREWTLDRRPGKWIVNEKLPPRKCRAGPNKSSFRWPSSSTTTSGM